MKVMKVFFLVILALLANADEMSSVTASAKVSDIGAIACQATATGATTASASAGCNTSEGFKIAYSSAELGIGPYGIGVDSDAYGSGTCCSSFGEGGVYYYWAQDFVIEGVQASGFVTPEVTGLCGGADGFGVSMNLWGAKIEDLEEPPGCNYLGPGPGGELVLNPPIPVTFGVPYLLQLSGKQACTVGEPEACGEDDTYLSNLLITDDAGNPLNIASVQDGVIILTPDPTSFSLLAIVVLSLVCLSRKLRRPFYSRARSLEARRC
jgi:hypothetical protein